MKGQTNFCAHGERLDFMKLQSLEKHDQTGRELRPPTYGKDLKYQK